MSKTTDSLESTCVLCCQGIKIYAVGPCNHPICFKCSTKMRVICDQLYCPVCRTDMPKMIFTNKLHPYEGIISHKFPNDRKHGISFASSGIQAEYRGLLAHQCKLCGIRRKRDDTFKKLQDHMRKEHELFACQLCVDHIKILSSERRFYQRKELAQHRRSGDPDDTSYRGHPLCEFCDDRYFDNDELLRHLRKDHYFCHFCEREGVNNQFYGEYEDLEDHFRSDHYLCEEEGCRGEKFTGAFHTEIDLKAHRTKVHSGKMTKLQARQARQVDVEISLTARPREYGGRGYRDRDRDREGAYGGGARGGRERYNNRDRTERDTAKAIEASFETAHQEGNNREKERKKKMLVKPKKLPRDERNATDSGRRTNDVPVTNAVSLREARSRIEQEEDKEYEKLKQEFTSGPVPVNNDVCSNGDTEPLDIPVEKEQIIEAPALPTLPEPKNDYPLGGSDFPTLSEPRNNFSTGGRWGVGPRQTQDEFPALGNGDGGADNVPMNVAASFGFYSSLASKNQSPGALAAEPAQGQTTGPVDQDFPTLSSIASLLGGSQKKIPVARKKNSNSAWKAPESAAVSQAPRASEFSAKQEKRPDSTGSGSSSKAKQGKKTDSYVEKETAKPKQGKKADGIVVNDKGKLKQEKKADGIVESDRMKAKPEKRADNPAVKQSVAAEKQPEAAFASASSSSRPPPGFAAFPPLSSSAFPPPGFSSLPSPAPAPAPGLGFVQPPDFKQRNRDLVSRIQGFCAGKDDLFAQFKMDSGEFRQGAITAGDYYRRCLGSLSEANFLSIFNELVTLLPDLVKQQELLLAHNDYKASKKAKPPQDKVLKISNIQPAKAGKQATKGAAAWKSSTSKADSSVCAVCSQVVLARDLGLHMNSHEEFPALGGGRAAPKPVSVPQTSWAATSWGRGK